MKKKIPRNIGRPRGMGQKTIDKCELVDYYYAKGELSFNDCIKKVKVSKASYYKWQQLKETNKL